MHSNISGQLPYLKVAKLAKAVNDPPNDSSPTSAINHHSTSTEDSLRIS